MRLLFANNFYYIRGGSERVMLDEMEGLRAAGHDVAIFARNHPLTLSCDDQKYFVTYKDFAACGGLDKLRWASSPIVNLGARRGMRRMLRDKRPHLVHAHNIYNGLSTSILDAAEAEGVPVVLTLHDCKLACPAYLMLRHGELCERCVGGKFHHCLTNRCAKGGLLGSAIATAESYYNLWRKKYLIPRYLICPSRFLQQKIIETGYPANRVLHIVNGVDPAHYEPNTKPGDYAIYIGRLSHEKGIYVLLDAFQGIDVPLKIVGTGPEAEPAQRQVRERRMDHVTFEGYQTGETLRDLCRNCAFSIIPSTWYENCPLSVIEMMAYGKPVIGSRIGGIPELIDDGRTGLVHDPGDGMKLRNAIVALWNDRARIRALGEKARERAETEFSLSRHQERLLAVYEQAIEEHRREKQSRDC